MNTTTDVTSAWPNRLMLLASAAAFLAGVVGFHWAGDRALMALGLLLAGLLAAVLLGLLSPSGRRFVAFSKEATHYMNSIGFYRSHHVKRTTATT